MGRVDAGPKVETIKEVVSSQVPVLVITAVVGRVGGRCRRRFGRSSGWLGGRVRAGRWGRFTSIQDA